MSASNKFVMDSRVPVSPSADKDDPSHPENVTKRAIMLQRQAHADSEQDIKEPIRQGPPATSVITYEARAGMLLPDADMLRDEDFPKPLPSGLDEAFKQLMKKGSTATPEDFQAVCSSTPLCKAVYYNKELRSIFFKKVSTPIPAKFKGTDALMGGTLYSKKTAAESFDNQTSTASPHPLLLLLLSILVGSVLIGVAVCYKLHIFYRFALAIGAMCAFRYAASVVQEPTTP